MRQRDLFLACVVVAGGVIGCGDNGNTTDAAVGNDAATTSETDGGGGGETLPAVLVDGAAAGYACAGSDTEPTAGEDVEAGVEVAVIALSDFNAANAPIELFAGAEVGAEGTGTTVTTNASGVATATLPGGGWFGYRLPATGSGATSVQRTLGYFYTFPESAGGQVSVTAISTQAATIVAGSLDRTLDADWAAVSGSVRDCSGGLVENVQIRMFRGDTEYVTGDSDGTPNITGLTDSAIPSPTSGGLTGTSGRFAGFVPAGTDPVRIEAWGSTADGSEAELLGCEEVLVEGAAITVAVVPPLRSDYPEGHGCAGR